jgi:hypothetical protein
LAPSERALWDATITEVVAGIYEPDADGKRPPESLYGSLKTRSGGWFQSALQRPRGGQTPSN